MALDLVLLCRADGVCLQGLLHLLPLAWTLRHFPMGGCFAGLEQYDV